MQRLVILIGFLLSPIVFASTLILGTTSTTVNSGLMDYLLPYYTKETGNEVKVITGGTGFILQQLERGDVPVAITHQRDMEEALIAKFPEGKRQPFMHNHFIIIGPKEDPAEVEEAITFVHAMKNIYTQKSLFISRGDNSGSHVFELKVWDEIDVGANVRQRPWYLSAGQDMGPTINMASAMNAYTIADQGTWLAYADHSQLKLLYEGVEDGKNDYSILQLQNSDDLPKEAAEFIDWLSQEDTHHLINNFKINGQTAFTAKNSVTP